MNIVYRVIVENPNAVRAIQIACHCPTHISIMNSNVAKFGPKRLAQCLEDDFQKDRAVLQVQLRDTSIKKKQIAGRKK